MRYALALLVLAACEAGGTGSAQQGVGNGMSSTACMAGQPDSHACDPLDQKKTTICHIPPGNPANEHTLCVGNAAVPAHLAHGDHEGACAAECTADGGTPSDNPPPSGNPPPGDNPSPSSTPSTPPSPIPVT